MAAVTTNAVAPTADTSNTTSYASPAFTPVVGDLLVVYAGASGTIATGTTLTASANGLTFTLVDSVMKRISQDTTYCFVANQLVPSSPASMTVTFTCTDAATSACVAIARISGMVKTGLAAIKQQAKAENVLAGSAPVTVFGANADTNNVTLFGQASTVGTTRTPPTGWTSQGETFLTAPTGGFYYGSRDSGFAGTTITGGSTTNGACSALSVELDTSAAAADAGFIHRRGPNYRR